MMEFADIFAYGLTTSVYVGGSLAMAFLLVTAMMWMNREPSEGALRLAFDGGL
jgi:hypothetical protein